MQYLTKKFSIRLVGLINNRIPKKNGSKAQGRKGDVRFVTFI